MSDTQAVNEATPEAPATDKREWAQKVLEEILHLMACPARLDVKDGDDGGISIAIHFEEEVPGLQVGKRSHFIDSLQVIVNRIVNRPGTDRRWVVLGAAAHPAPRPPPPERNKLAAPAPGQPAAPATASVPKERPAPGSRRPGKAGEASAPPKGREPEEASLQVTEEPALAAAARSLAEKSASLGRCYAVAGMKPEDRARLLRGAADVVGVKVNIEGEGRSRRVVFIPEKLAPMPRRTSPGYDDDE